MSIIDTLNSKEDRISKKLYTLATDIAQNASAHLKRVQSVLTEFDLHDESHSIKIIENIEKLLGDNEIETLSSYELFLIYLSAYLHDCAMAPSDYEILVLKLTEGTDEYNVGSSNSLRNDTKTPLGITDLKELINSNKNELFGSSENNDFSNWMFRHDSEADFIDYLAITLQEYQGFRNQFRDELLNIETQHEFNCINDSIRIDYIRETHHKRVEVYIKNLQNQFSNYFDKGAWAKMLVHDLATICRAHGEDLDYIKKLDIKRRYNGDEHSNIQLISMLLRLGDIIHFDHDRAPINLRASKKFESNYSFKQWAIKANSGVNYSISNNTISYTAFCDDADTYYSLLQYIKYVNIEIENYRHLNRESKSKYLNDINDVDTKDIKANRDNFKPRNELCFSLNQGKIIELLMGVGLYKDKFACLRELYQNSLDACRCMLSDNNSQGLTGAGKIEFGISEDKSGRYLYCLDNGIGMNESIIEKYLLNIGTSYYKSKDFNKQLSEWGNSFTPISQFGIGILSCFMIGDKMEIITKKKTDSIIACAINGPHEYLYYYTPAMEEQELIGKSGTLVKVYLNEDIIINNSDIDDLGLNLLLDNNDEWKNHLYYILNNFIVTKHINVSVSVKTLNKKEIIINKPLVILPNEKIAIKESNYPILDNYINKFNQENKISYIELVDSFEIYPMHIEYNDCVFSSMLILPKKNIDIDFFHHIFRFPQIMKNCVAIDGINVNNGGRSIDTPYLEYLTHNGCLTYWGSVRPKLSVDRTTIIDDGSIYEGIYKEIALRVIKNKIEIVKTHLEKYDLISSTPLYNLVWDYIFNNISLLDKLFVEELAHTEFGNMSINQINIIAQRKITISEFMNEEVVTFHNYDYRKLGVLEKKLILTKLCNARNLTCEHFSKIEFTYAHNINRDILSFGNRPLDYCVYIKTDKWSHEYDIVTSMYPLVPERFFIAISDRYNKDIDERIKLIVDYGNHTSGLFSQSPLLIHPTMGMYIKGYSLNSKKERVYCFDQKRPEIHLGELHEEDYYTKERKVVFIFIPPLNYDTDTIIAIERYKTIDSEYYKGVTEGWSILLTGMKNADNSIIKAGKHSRDEIVRIIKSDFWDKYGEYNFSFLDGTSMTKNVGVNI